MNGLTSPKTGAADWPPGPRPRAARGAPEPSDAFAGMLNAQQARTATAEGQEKSPEARPTGPEPHEDAPTAETPGAPVEAATESPAESPIQGPADDQSGIPVVAASPVPAAVEPSLPPAPVASVPAGNAPTVTVPAVTAPAVAPVQQQPAAQPGATPVVPQVVVATAQQPGTPAAPVDDAPDVAPSAGAVATVAVEGDAPAEPVAKQPLAAGAVPAQAKPSQQGDSPAGGGQQQPGQQQTPQQQAQQPQPQQQPLDQARNAVRAYSATQQADAPATQPAAPSATPATPSAAVRPADVATPATPVPLARAAETVEHVLRLASARGVSHARVMLRPAELGSIDIHLRQTSEGLVARVVAATPEAAQQLQQAAGDLRRSLEQQGLTLVGLDIGQSGGDRLAGRSGASAGDGEGAHGDQPGGTDASADDDDETTSETLQLPNGVLVDVLA